METRKRILVIEDAELVREALCSVLQSDGFDVTGCGDGRAGLMAVQKNLFDVVVTDYRMPHLSGLDVTRILRERFPAMVIIGVSADNKAPDFLRAGANAFLRKPYSYDDLTQLLS